MATATITEASERDERPPGEDLVMQEEVSCAWGGPDRPRSKGVMTVLYNNQMQNIIEMKLLEVGWVAIFKEHVVMHSIII